MEYDVSELLLSLISRGCLFAFSVLIITYASRRVVKQEMESTPELEESNHYYMIDGNSLTISHH